MASQDEGGTEGFLDKSFLERIHFTVKEAVLGGKATSMFPAGAGTTGIMKHKPDPLIGKQDRIRQSDRKGGSP